MAAPMPEATPGAGEAAAAEGNAALNAPGLPPPPPAWPQAEAPAGEASDAAAVAELQRRIGATREQLSEVQALLEELPAIFEQRFLGRLEPLLEQRRALLGETAELRSHLLELQRSGRALRALEGAPASAAPSLRQRLLAALGRAGEAGPGQPDDDRRAA